MPVQKIRCLFCLVCSIGILQAGIHVNLQNSFGHNIVDIEEAANSQFYNENTPQSYYLEDWDFFHYMGAFQLLYTFNEHIGIGAELGFNRLYYWLEKYSLGYTGGWREGTVWTMNYGFLLLVYPFKRVYLQAGLSPHTFLDESGTSLGVMASVGYELRFGAFFTVPVEFRVNSIFGRAVSFAPCMGLGLKLRFGEME